MTDRNLRIGSIVFGLVVGALVAVWSYHWITDPAGRAERVEQERIVLRARELLVSKLELADPDIVDPLAADRRVGKVYVYPRGSGFEVSGYYRRGEDDRWHPYLMTLAGDGSLELLKVEDSNVHVVAKTVRDPTLEVVVPDSD